MAHAANPLENAAFELFLKQNLGRDLLRFTTAGSVDECAKVMERSLL